MSVLDWLLHRQRALAPPSPRVLLAERRPQTLRDAAEMEQERLAIMARVADACQDNALDHEDARRADVA